MPKALVFGVAGQDGSYLSDLLVSKGYQVIGATRRASIPRYDNLFHLLNNEKFELVEGDITDPSSVQTLMRDHQPDECYNLAAQSHVQTSFNQPSLTFQVNAVGVLNILEAIKDHSKHTKFYQASTSEMFGNNYSSKATKYDDRNEPYKYEKYQDENTTFAPRSPYGVAKLAAHEMVKVYRESYGVYACSGILFNHESERRGHNFLTRKVTLWLKKFVADHSVKLSNSKNFPIYLKDDEKLRLGNLQAYRDWGFAGDYVEAMWLMLQQTKPVDFVIATGKCNTVAEFVQKAFWVVNKELNYEDYITIDPKFYRPNEVDYLSGNAVKARAKLGWKPKVGFTDLVERMVRSDVHGL